MLKTFSMLVLVRVFGADLLVEATGAWIAKKWKAAGITDHDVVRALHKGYEDALGSIEFCLLQRQGLLDSIGKRRHQDITDNLNRMFLSPFALEKNLGEEEFGGLAGESVEYCNTLREAVDNIIPRDEVFEFTIEDLLLSIHSLKGAEDLHKLGESARSDFMASLHKVAGIPELFFELLNYKGLLTWSAIFFFAETIKSDERIKSILTDSELRRIRESQSRQHREQIARFESVLEAPWTSFEQCLGPIMDNLSEIHTILSRRKAGPHGPPDVAKHLERIIKRIRQDGWLSEMEQGEIQKHIEALKHEYWAMRYRAAEALGKIGGQATVPPLIVALQDGDADVRRAAAVSLGRVGPEAGAAVPVLLRVALQVPLQDEDWAAQCMAAWALGKIGGQAFVPDLLKALKDTDEEVRSIAAIALGEVGDQMAEPDLIQALKDDYSGVRQGAASALAQIGDEAAVPALIEVLKDEDLLVRDTAARALGNIGDQAAVPALLQALKDEDSWVVREAAIVALGKIGDEAAAPRIIEALKDESRWVRQVAAEALKKLEGND